MRAGKPVFILALRSPFWENILTVEGNTEGTNEQKKKNKHVKRTLEEKNKILKKLKQKKKIEKNKEE